MESNKPDGICYCPEQIISKDGIKCKVCSGIIKIIKRKKKRNARRNT